jgi:hypothetical protein
MTSALFFFSPVHGGGGPHSGGEGDVCAGPLRLALASLAFDTSPATTGEEKEFT